jgi:hypothetical protein
VTRHVHHGREHQRFAGVLHGGYRRLAGDTEFRAGAPAGY